MAGLLHQALSTFHFPEDTKKHKEAVHSGILAGLSSHIKECTDEESYYISMSTGVVHTYVTNATNEPARPKDLIWLSKTLREVLTGVALKDRIPWLVKQPCVLVSGPTTGCTNTEPFGECACWAALAPR